MFDVADLFEEYEESDTVSVEEPKLPIKPRPEEVEDEAVEVTEEFVVDEVLAGPKLPSPARFREIIRDLEHQISAVSVDVNRMVDETRKRRKYLASLVEELTSVLADSPTIEYEEKQPDRLAPGDWRSIPTIELFTPSIVGCGEKKIIAITELCPTLGDLDDLRARGRSFNALLPPGCGKGLADELEERMLNAAASKRS